MKHLRILIDAISEYPLEVDVLLFMAVCFLVLLIVAYAMGERASHRFTAERNEAFLRKMRVGAGLSSRRAPLLDPMEKDPIRGRGELSARQCDRDEQPGEEEPAGRLSHLKELPRRPSLGTVRQAQAPSPASELKAVS